MNTRTCYLTEVRHLFDRFAEISAEIYSKIGQEFDADTYPARLEDWAKRGHSVAYAEDGGVVVGFFLSGPSATFTSGSAWLSLKLELVRLGHRPDDFMVAHACHVLPSHWKKGLTRTLLAAVTGARQEPMHLTIDCPTPELEAWASALPDTTPVGRSPHGKIAMITPAASLLT